MRKRFSEIKDSRIFTADDLGVRPIGNVTDLLIEDGSWTVRYLVVSTDAPLARKVLISPAAVHSMDLGNKSIATMLTSEQVVQSPSLAFDQPISRQYEQALVDYYGWPIYWFGRTILKAQTLESVAGDEVGDSVDEDANSNLRSSKEICGYQIESQQGRAGEIDDLVVQIESWAVDHVVSNAATWLPAGDSMFSVNWISHLDWKTRTVSVDLTKAARNPISTEPKANVVAFDPPIAPPSRFA